MDLIHQKIYDVYFFIPIQTLHFSLIYYTHTHTHTDMAQQAQNYNVLTNVMYTSFKSEAYLFILAL